MPGRTLVRDRRGSSFGVGAGLRIRRVRAGWIHLQHVYWGGGRASLDAVVLVTAFMALVGSAPSRSGLSGRESFDIGAVAVAQALVLSIITFMKGRIGLGCLSIFVPFPVCGAPSGSARRARRGRGGSTLSPSSSGRATDSRRIRSGTASWNGFFNAIGGRADDPAAEEDPV